MALHLPAYTFPTFVLTQEEVHMLEDAAEAIVKNTIAQYYEFLTVDNSVVDEKRWRKIKTQADVRVYLERKASLSARSAHHDSDEISRSNSSGSSGDSNQSKEVSTMASMLTVGSIPGTLEDFMYGILSPTTEEMQLKTAYVGDGLADWCVLASIIKPSEKDPFRAMNIKWTLYVFPLPVSAVAWNRDQLFLESVGFAMTPNGERIGYRVSHSVSLPGVRELTELKIVRSRFSACEFFRQRNENSVEVYSRVECNIMGDGSEALAARSLSGIPIRAFKHVHCSEMKKLARMLRSSQHQKRGHHTDTNSLEASTSSGSSSSPVVPFSVPLGTCALCSQKTSSSGGVGLPFSITSTKEKQCRICAALVCARCCVEKTMFSPTEVEKQLASESVTFCTRCILRASSASSFKFAVLDALESEGKPVDYTEALR